ncbi:unnamed protein product [Penicillium salamii]|uniref:Uncharacterized protein n=1 Tax=Penicillium salamii TaxID=1612424 RepID=A0A9W4K4W4_9EURO|nr:unnamed protein product [Penicillium salamii]CAG8065826.1 unnamed protein product [Penicillium salamii]CAG8311787.1 unnamed protein product [Penicillium salamii]CAG8315827.1 unnamed protein product [Penicillium salamii]CAG8321516.1 unnamed protein product [Penicillium salamii]
MHSPTSSRTGSTASTPPVDHSGLSRVFQITKGLMDRHYKINSLNDQPLFYGDISLFTPNKPDLTLHVGSSTQGPVVAVSNFLKLSGNYKIGVGNPDDMSNVQWEDMTKELLHKPKYRLETTVPCGSDQSHSERRSLVWKRTRSVGVDGETPSRLTVRNYKLVDERSEQVLAVFSGGRRPGRGGKIEIRVEYGQDFDHLVLISCLSLYEKARRRSHRGAAGGGGGS